MLSTLLNNDIKNITSTTNDFIATTMNEKYLTAAETIAKKICTEAIWYNNQCNWLTLSAEPLLTGTTDYAKLMSSSFYDGLSGVLHFLTSLYSLKPNPILKNTIEGTIQTILQQELNNKENENLSGKLGFHTGWLGVAFVLWNTGEIMKNDDYKNHAELLLQKCISLDASFYGLDIIDGIAGAIPVFLFFNKATSNTKYIEFAIQLGNILLSKAHKENNTLSWNTMIEAKHNLTGYGHGAAGMAHAFTELYHSTNEDFYKEIVGQIIQYENNHFKKEENNWPDYRNFAAAKEENKEEKYSCSCAWCHGAPGIGLSRIRCYETTKNNNYLEDALKATDTTLMNNQFHYGFNFSLCHGLLGNAELLLKAYEITKDEKYLRNIESIVTTLIDEFINENKLLPSGLQSNNPVIDFMLGESGMGYFLLRLYNKDLFKNMLLFTP